MKNLLLNDKVKLLTHNDLDACATYIIARCYFKKENINAKYCSPNSIDNEAKYFLENEKDKFKYVFITDISFSEKIAKAMDKYVDEYPNTIVKLLDHHKTALHLNDYKYASVIIEQDGEAICGAKLFYQYLIKELGFKRIPILEEWLKLVNDYDTWLWKTKYNYKKPKHWNELLYLYDRTTFVNNVLDKIKKEDISFSKTDLFLLEIEHKKQKAYIKAKMNEIIIKDIKGVTSGIIFAEQYVDELSSEIYKKYPDTQLQIIITSKKISYRCRYESSTFDVSEFVKQFGGGGHSKAAGSTIAQDIKNQYINLLFNEKL